MGQIIEVLLFDGWGILRKEKVRVGTIVDFKSSCNDFDVEFEVLPLVDIDNIDDERQRRIVAGNCRCG